MTLKELQDFIDEEHERLIALYKDADNRLLSRTVKVTEEVGELANEILTSLKDQRSSKLKGDNRKELEDEFADVLITTFLLAKEANVDIGKALKNKIQKIKKRKH